MASAKRGYHPVPALSNMTLNDKSYTDPNRHLPQPKEQIVNPSTIAAADERGIDYNKVVDQFGTGLIDQVKLDRFERLTGQKVHRYLRRGLFFSQRYILALPCLTCTDLGSILDRCEKGKPFLAT